jgi:hypothetical protein
MTNFAPFLTGVATAIVGWVGLNFFGGPIVALREKRREALEVAERYRYVGILTDTNMVLVNDTSLLDMRPRPPNEYQTKAHAELSDAGNSLRTFVRERAFATRIYCWVLGYDLDFAARALLSLGEAVRGVYQDKKARRLTLHTLFLALGVAHDLSVGETAAARAEMKQVA